MDTYPNHAFRPRQLVRRSDLAVVLSRLLGLAGRRQPDRLREWEAATPSIADLPRGHLAYRPAATAVASGVLALSAGGLFQPSRLVSGAETIEAIRLVEELIR